MIWVLIIVLLIIGCSYNQESGTKVNEEKSENGTVQNNASDLKINDFFPLELGYIWEYQGDGNEYASFNREVVFSKDNLYQIREDNGGTVIASVFKVTSSDITRIFSVAEAYGEENYLDSEPNESLTILKGPIEIGLKWEDKNGTREIGSINETVSTPAGDFSNCIKVIISSEDGIVNEYYKDGIGMVKREFISGETEVTSSLKKFSKK